MSREPARAATQRAQQPSGPTGHQRIDPDLSDPWAPEVVLVARPLDRVQQRRVVDLVSTEPRPTLAVVAVGAVAGALWTLDLPAEPEIVDQPGIVHRQSPEPGFRHQRVAQITVDLDQQHGAFSDSCLFAFCSDPGFSNLSRKNPARRA